MKFSFGISLFLLLLTCCKQKQGISNALPEVNTKYDQMQVAHLGDTDQSNFQAIQKAFVHNNPGYDLAYFQGIKKLNSSTQNRVVFIQEGGGTATLSGNQSSKFSVGEIILLKPDTELSTDSLFSGLVFIVPEAIPENIPAFIRPDWDPKITDTPGGCATETNAYRRILLTWLNKVGPYQFHAINAHRVRIMDSFTHYHPIEGGFDEFYLVQMVMPEGQLITSSKLDLIKDPENLKRDQVSGLLQTTKLQVGDLVYLPRGVIHRGLNGVLAQVITIPGFVPKSEIGIDHYIKQINDKFNLKGEDALPFNVSASKAPVVK